MPGPRAKYFSRSLPFIFTFLWLLLQTSIVLAAPVADILVKGKVTNVSGEPIRGVSILVKGTAKGTSSDINGDYSITVAEDAVLTFSSVGYETQEVSVAGRPEINVTLQNSTKAIDQVVVVGYGTQRKRDLTGSISSVSGAEISKQPVLTATQALQGKVAGVQIISSGAPNSAPIVRIRGTGSVLAAANPVYVVDGVITDDIRNINTADIVSTEILKDASSAAIYGVRASNGVILITTRKGRVGMQVTYDGRVGIREASKIVKMANSAEYATYINEASVNTGNGEVLVDPVTTVNNTDWFETIIGSALFHEHNTSISGGSEKANYYFGAGYLSDEGIVINNKFERYTARTNNEFRPSAKVKVNTIISYAHGQTQDVNLGSAYNNAYHAAPTIPSKINGKYGNTSAFQNVGNPLVDIENNNNKYRENKAQGNFSLEIKPIGWITLKTSYGIELYYNQRVNYTGKLPNDTTVFLVAGGNQKTEKSNLMVANEHAYRWVWDNTATAQRVFEKHDITLLVGTSAERISVQSQTGTRTGVPPDRNLWYLDLGDPQSQQNSSFVAARNVNSYLGRVNYAYDKKYLLTASLRADGSSSFREHWGYFPAIGIGWVISDEKFMEKQKLIEFLKLRASWGKLGNENIDPTARFQTLRTGLPYVFNGTVVSGSTLLDVVDRNIKWESTEETDIGVEATLIDSRMRVEIDVYQKKVKNALSRVRIPGVLGDPDGLIITNVATIENKGIELSLNWKGDIGKDIKYTVGGNVSYNQNKVVALNGGEAIYGGFVGQKGSTTYTNNGQPIGAWFILESQGVFHNQTELASYVTSNGTPITINDQLPTLGDLRYRDINDDGKINDDDRQFFGSYQPDFLLGLNATFNYKAFDLSIGAYGTIGSKIYNGKKAARYNSLDNVEADVASDRWTFTNYASDVPRANLYAIPQSTYFLENGNFARINNLTIGYTLPESIRERLHVTNFRVYVASQNLATFTNYSGFSPEINNGDAFGQGIEFNPYPTTRTYTLGVNLTF
jgi:TonB-dependent starch-binding outer membrane protein SusC